MNSTPERKYWIDLLNILACFCVVALHCTNYQVHCYNGTPSIPYYIGLFTHSFMFWPVPVFMMITGCNLICYGGGWKSYANHRLIRTVIPFVVWSILYWFLNFRGETDMSILFQLFINGRFSGHMWFFIPLFVCYLTIPFISAYIKGATESLRLAFILICFIFVSVAPFVFDIFSIPFIKGGIFPMGMQLIMYTVIGYEICNLSWFTAHRRIIYFIGILSAIIQFLALFLLTYSSGKPNELFLHYEYPTTFLMAVAVFLWFSKIDLDTILSKMHLSKNTIRRISSCSLGIYLIHPAIIYVSETYGLHLSNPYFGCFLIYVVSLFIVYCMKQIPMVKYIVP